MKHRFGFMLPVLALLLGAPAFADWDPAEEARYEAERKAAQQAEQEKQREIQKMQDDAQAKYDAEVMQEKRKTLGAAANGKSDAEVIRLYDAKVAEDMAAANLAAARAREALSSGQGAAAVKQVTGKTMEELENMTDEEAEALGREMEQKYGNE
jgi:hypothetical protein